MNKMLIKVDSSSCEHGWEAEGDWHIVCHFPLVPGLIRAIRASGRARTEKESPYHISWVILNLNTHMGMWEEIKNNTTREFGYSGVGISDLWTATECVDI